MPSGRLEKEMLFYEKMKEKLTAYPEIFTEYFNSMRANRKSYTTIGVYINYLIHFAKFVTDDEIPPDFHLHITSRDVENYMISLETKKTKNGLVRMGDDILQARWSALNTFFTWLLKRKYITENPIAAVDRPKNNTQHEVVYLTENEIHSLLKAIDRSHSQISAVRDRAMIGLALATAMRISAILNINLEDVDLEARTINVIEKRQKIRKITIGSNTARLLDEWIKLRSREYAEIETTALFISQYGTRLSVVSANNALEKYCSAAHIRRITFHKLRATAACILARKGTPLKTISKQLNHNSISVTQRYVAAFEEDNQQAINTLDELV